MTREEVKELVMRISIYYPNYKIENPTNTIDAWYMMLQDEDCMKVALSLKEYIKTDKTGFAPSIGNLLSRLVEKESELIDESIAWGMVYKAICNSGYNSESEFAKLPQDIQRAVGSASQLKQWGMNENFNNGVESSNFYKRLNKVRERMKNEKIMGTYNKNQIGTENLKQLASDS